MKFSPEFSKEQKKRFYVITIILCAAALILIAKYANLMLGPPYTQMESEARQIGERGLILDRTGRTLAIQTRFGNISVWKPDLNADRAIEEFSLLGNILSIEPQEIARRIETSPGKFIYLERHVDNEKIKQIEAAIASDKLHGINIETVLGRVYPEQNLAGSIIGIVGDENKGLEGIEHTYDRELSARFENGEAVSGSQIMLTIDINVQYILEDIARRVLENNEAEFVLLMAMDPRSGEILGSASMPGFNPNFFRESRREERIHRPVEYAYEPGSVFKIFSLALMLDEGTILPSSTFYCNGAYEHTTNLGEHIKINCLGAHGTVTAREIIILSCNAGAGYAGERMPKQPFYDGIRALGFGAKTGAELPGEAAGIVRQPDRWSERSKPTLAMGQEIAVSAIQMMEAATAIANNGLLVRPHFVKMIAAADGKTTRWESAPETRRVIKPETARMLRSYMKATADEGTGSRAGIPDLSLAVKTGTSQMRNSVTGAYSETDHISSCMAMLPAEDPALVLYLVIVKPQGEYLAGRIAAPPIRETAEQLAAYLGIPRGKNPQISHSDELILPQQKVPVVGDFMPDLTGFSKRALLPIVLDDNLKVELRGDGWVKRQYPPPGATLNADSVIILELE